MPLYDYRCPDGHVTERLRKAVDRDDPSICATCNAPATRTPSLTHRQPDGLYSHDPNFGDPLGPEKVQAARKTGGVIDRSSELRE